MLVNVGLLREKQMASEPPKAELGFRASLWHWLRRPQWSVLAPALVIVFTGVFTWQIFFAQTDLDKGLAALNAAYRMGRPLEARLTGIGYAPFEHGKAVFDERKWKLAEDFLLKRTQNVNTPAVLHARGQFKLATHLFDDARQQFEAALKLDPNNASLHNDLGVAWLEQATLQRTAPDAGSQFAQSRAHFEQALQHEPNHLEALFNLALLNFRQGLWKQAEDGWNLYLTKDSRSGWAQEAKNYLNQIKTLKQQTTNSNV
jgi:tetratricopeptide (TPR) repeat protein